MAQEYINDYMSKGIETVKMFGEDDGKPIKMPEHQDTDEDDSKSK